MSFWDDMKINKCISADVCMFKDSTGCQYTCYQYHSMQKLLEYSNLPKKYCNFKQLTPSSQDVKEFEWLKYFINDIRYHVENCHGLYLWSPEKGNGKTTMATRILLEYFNAIAMDFDMTRSRGLYINLTTFIEEMKDGFGDADKNAETLLLKDRIRRADIVVWDDIGVETPTPFVKQFLYASINYRYSNNLTQIFTSNCSLDDLVLRLGDDRIVDRLYEHCRPIRFHGGSRREKGAWWNIK